MTFGLTKKINDMDGGSSSIGYNSSTYTAGKVTGIGLTIATAAAGGATGAALADGKAGANFGRGTATVFNGRPGGAFIRFGWGWNQNLAGGAGRDIIRLGIGAARGTSWWSHITFWVVR